MKIFDGASLHMVRKEKENVPGDVKSVDLGDITEEECKSLHDCICKIESIIGPHKSHIWISEGYHYDE